MHPAIMAIAVSTQMLTPVSDAIPKLNVEATCKGSVEADKAMGLALPQSFDKCMSDENSARQQLDPIWSSSSPAVRAQCEGEATIGDASYVEDAAASGAQEIAGRFSVSDSQACRTNDADAYGKTVWSWHPLLVSSRRRSLRTQPGSTRSLIRRRR
jgi:hypothetical protein